MGLWLWSGLFALVAAACGQASSSGAGSNSNWLRRCVDDVQCGDGLSCWCGACTKPCGSNEACGELDPTATCRSASSCTSAPATGNACAIACQSNAQCATDQVCANGMCKSVKSSDIDLCAAERSARNTFLATHRSCRSNDDCQQTFSSCQEGRGDDTGAFYLNQSADLTEFAALSDALFACATDPKRGPDTCSLGSTSRVPSAPICQSNGLCGSIVETAANACGAIEIELTRSVGAIVNAADKSCQVDSDCAAVSVGNTCRTTCTAAGVAATAKTSIDASITAAGADLCAQWTASSCPPPPSLSCLPTLLTCVLGTCQSSTTQSCSAYTTEIANAMQAAEAAASRACVVDSDCVRIERANACYDGCASEAISASAATGLAENFARIGYEKCPDSFAGGCTNSVPSCLPSTPAVCDQGQCR